MPSLDAHLYPLHSLCWKLCHWLPPSEDSVIKIWSSISCNTSFRTILQFQSFYIILESRYLTIFKSFKSLEKSLLWYIFWKPAFRHVCFIWLLTLISHSNKWIFTCCSLSLFLSLPVMIHAKNGVISPKLVASHIPHLLVLRWELSFLLYTYERLYILLNSG